MARVKPRIIDGPASSEAIPIEPLYPVQRTIQLDAKTKEQIAQEDAINSEHSVRKDCGITLSSERIKCVPRISNRDLPDIVKSNIARLQNIHQPLVREAKLKLRTITSGIASIGAHEFNLTPVNTGNPFKRKFDNTHSSPNDLSVFQPPPPSRTRHTIEQYRVLKSNEKPRGNEENNVENIPFVSTRPTDIEIITNEIDSDILDIQPVQTLDDLIFPPSLSPSPVQYSSPIACDSEKQTGTPVAVNTYIDTNSATKPTIIVLSSVVIKPAEQSSTTDTIRLRTSLPIKLDRSRLNLSNIIVRSNTLGEPPKVGTIAQYQRFPFNDYSPAELQRIIDSEGNSFNRKQRTSPPRSLPLWENRQPDPETEDTDTEETGRETPKGKALEPFVCQLPTRSQDKRKQNEAMRTEARNALQSYRSHLNSSVFDRLD